MSKKHPTEVRERAVRMALDCVKDYPSTGTAGVSRPIGQRQAKFMHHL